MPLLTLESVTEFGWCLTSLTNFFMWFFFLSSAISDTSLTWKYLLCLNMTVMYIRTGSPSSPILNAVPSKVLQLLPLQSVVTITAGYISIASTKAYRSLVRNFCGWDLCRLGRLVQWNNDYWYCHSFNHTKLYDDFRLMRPSDSKFCNYKVWRLNEGRLYVSRSTKIRSCGR
jgi:hypothetical protein